MNLIRGQLAKWPLFLAEAELPLSGMEVKLKRDPAINVIEGVLKGRRDNPNWQHYMIDMIIK